MKVLFLVYRDFKNPAAVGGDLYFWELAKGLAQIGNSVTILCSAFKGAKCRERIDGVEIVRLNNSVFLPFYVFKEYMKRQNSDVVVEEAIGGQRFPFFGTLYIKQPLVSVWHQKNRRIFQEQYPLPVALVLSIFEVLQARLYKKRVIVTPSQGARSELLTLGFEPQQVKVVYDGILTTNSAICKLKEQRREMIVWLGKIRRYKRPDHVICALSKVNKALSRKIDLVIAGKVSEFDGNYLEELKELAQKLCVADNVKFRLNISECEKNDLLSSSYLLVQPSPVEGFSLVVVEANCLGTPVIASSGVPKDVVIENFNGLVYQYGAIDCLSQAICKLFSDPLLWQRLSENSSKWALNFTWEKSTNRLQEILMETLQ